MQHGKEGNERGLLTRAIADSRSGVCSSSDFFASLPYKLSNRTCTGAGRPHNAGIIPRSVVVTGAAGRFIFIFGAGYFEPMPLPLPAVQRGGAENIPSSSALLSNLGIISIGSLRGMCFFFPLNRWAPREECGVFEIDIGR